MEVICKEVVITNLTVRGNGTDINPYRTVTQVWDKDGQLIAENDYGCSYFNAMDMIAFVSYCIEKNMKIVNLKDLELWKNKQL